MAGLGGELNVSTATPQRTCPSVQGTLPTPADQTMYRHLAGNGPKAFCGILKLAFFPLVSVLPQPGPESREAHTITLCPP